MGAAADFPLLQWHKEAALNEEEVAQVNERWGFEADSALRPTPEELRLNSRSRSAVLHILRKKKGFRCEDLEAAADKFFEWESGSAGVVAQNESTDEPPKKKKKKVAA